MIYVYNYIFVLVFTQPERQNKNRSFRIKPKDDLRQSFAKNRRVREVSKNNLLPPMYSRDIVWST